MRRAWLALLLLVVTGCGKNPLAPKKETHNIRYVASGTVAEAVVSYETGGGGNVTETVALPWSRSYTVKSGFAAVLVVANLGDSGTVTAEIYLDDKLWKTATANGAAGMASASGAVP